MVREQKIRGGYCAGCGRHRPGDELRPLWTIERFPEHEGLDGNRCDGRRGRHEGEYEEHDESFDLHRHRA